jgi:hypothetical protein
MHCERKAAENALSLVRRYPHRGRSVTLLTRLAHEETSHVVQVATLIGQRGWTPRGDMPNQYARQLLATVRGQEPERLLDALLVAAFIEACWRRDSGAAETPSWKRSTRPWPAPRSATPRSSSSLPPPWFRPRSWPNAWRGWESEKPRSSPRYPTVREFTDLFILKRSQRSRTRLARGTDLASRPSASIRLRAFCGA